MALNYRRTGRGGAAAKAVVAGFALTALTLLVAYPLPAGASTLVAFALVYAMMQTAKSLQGAAVTEHTSQGGRLASRWAAAGVGVSVLIAIVAVIAGYVFLSTPRSKVVIGERDEVYYMGRATENDARAIGEALKNAGYFQNQGASVLISKGLGRFYAVVCGQGWLLGRPQSSRRV